MPTCRVTRSFAASGDDKPAATANPCSGRHEEARERQDRRQEQSDRHGAMLSGAATFALTGPEGRRQNRPECGVS